MRKNAKNRESPSLSKPLRPTGSTSLGGLLVRFQGSLLQGEPQDLDGLLAGELQADELFQAVRFQFVVVDVAAGVGIVPGLRVAVGGAEGDALAVLGLVIPVGEGDLLRGLCVLGSKQCAEAAEHVRERRGRRC